MTVTFRHSIVGNDETFYFTGKDSDGNPEDITGDTITFRAFDSDGNEIVKTTDDDITLYAQSGSTLGQAAIPIYPADYPQAWLALGFQDARRVNVVVERVTDAGVVIERQFGEWKVLGQGIA